jgi:hypothetical protein
MIGKPIPHPRDVIISELERYKRHFFETGNIIQKIPTGKSAYVTSTDSKPCTPLGSFQKLQRLERAKLAPVMQGHAKAGFTITEAANAMKLKHARAELIAKENGISFKRR